VFWQVLVAAAAAVVAVLGLQALGILVPPLDDVLASAPVIVAVLVVGTLVVLVSALRPRQPR
jgi:hypothetical protein